MATATSPAPSRKESSGLGRGNAFLVSLQMALTGLGANKLRSFLTMLGVIIGVGAVIVAISIGEGSKAAVEESIQKLGSNVLTVLPGQQRRGGVSMGFGSQSTMKLSDVELIKRSCPSVGDAYPSVNKSSTIKATNKNTSTTVNGNGPSYPTVSNHPVQYGRYFSADDVRSQKRVAALGSTTAKDLFGTASSALNKTIRINSQSFKVVAVMKEKGGMGFRNPDDAVYVPVTTAMRRLFGIENVNSITVQAKSFGLMSRAQTELEKVMQKRLGTSSTGNNFIIFNQADIAATQNEQQDTFGNLIKYLAIVSLVVGGIGIMNIMLVSVTERTREIGIRKAIGARRLDILTQFLLEALFLSLVGGLIGVGMGKLGSDGIAQANGWRVQVSWSSISLAFGFSAVVGIFFGFYPALKASNLSPIDALRYE
ncbi:ABC transporter permease [Armatimonas sp.]|uniref:ABC transporter permease n=1 Tax=Armatimonas sp. TaxID=1872638 RepID=UPI00286C8334|nr:ABC transporter permease [Armatimonas sp.]